MSGGFHILLDGELIEMVGRAVILVGLVENECRGQRASRRPEGMSMERIEGRPLSRVSGTGV